MTDGGQLDFLLALFQPLLRLEQAAFLLDECTQRQVQDLLDEGKLRGVNIASNTETRRELRIYRYSVEHRIIAPHLPLTLITADKILPHHRPTILRRELAEWIGCSEQHVSNLNLAGPRDSADSRHRIYREAIVDFINTRTIE